MILELYAGCVTIAFILAFIFVCGGYEHTKHADYKAAYYVKKYKQEREIRVIT